MKYGLIFLSFILGACSTCMGSKCPPPTEPQVIFQPSDVVTITPPGNVESTWESPMVDVIDVPPGVDPEGIYYRPGHQEVVEIRQGRWQYHKEK